MTSFTSCSDDSDSQKSNAAAEGELVATVDGSEFETSTQAATLFNGIFNLTAIDASTGDVITITVSDAAEGTFDLGIDSFENGAVYAINGENSYVSLDADGGGKITISEIDLDNGTVTGTFNFTGVRESFDDNNEIIAETIEVTNGAFNKIPLMVDIPGQANSSLTAKIDGDAVTFDSVNIFGATGTSSLMVSAINNSTHENISLKFPQDVTPGTYDLTDDIFANYQGFYNPNLGGGTTNYLSASGSITISGYNTATGVIQGTFEFVGESFIPEDPVVTYVITEGEFSVILQ